MSGSCIMILDVSNNKFESVPTCVCDMLMLKELYLSGNNDIYDFPKEMGNLKPDVKIPDINKMDQVRISFFFTIFCRKLWIFFIQSTCK